MAVLKDCLSIWEVAHRWHNQNPFTSNSRKLPLEVHDRIHWIVDSILRQELHLTSKTGVRYKNECDLKSFDDYERELREQLSAEEFADEFSHPTKPGEDPVYTKYLDYEDRITYRHKAATKALQQEFDQKRYSKKICDQRFVDSDGIYECCQLFGEELPDFWSDYFRFKTSETTTTQEPLKEESETNLDDEAKCRKNVLDRIAIQAAARVFFEFTEYAPVDIRRHDIIQLKCNGKQWGEDTIKRWIAEVNPTKGKSGRPRKEGSETASENRDES